jgi:hypothetical protein
MTFATMTFAPMTFLPTTFLLRLPDTWDPSRPDQVVEVSPLEEEGEPAVVAVVEELVVVEGSVVEVAVVEEAVVGVLVVGEVSGDVVELGMLVVVGECVPLDPLLATTSPMMIAATTTTAAMAAAIHFPLLLFCGR